MSIDNSLASSVAISGAEANGHTVVFPAVNQLQIDIDDEAGYAIYSANLELLQRYYHTESIIETPSKSGGHCRHITITLRENLRSDTERIVLQACLGSDLKREFLSFARVLHRDAHPTLFIEDSPTGDAV